jgi:deazaflavin-dependent oxidoreductase (nitroreductase family)
MPTVGQSVKDTAAKLTNLAHRSIFNASSGRLGGRLGSMPVVELTTTGRKSGLARKTMLASPVQDADRVVLVASWGGDDRHPTWFLNLRDNPGVEITLAGRHRKMRARVASPEEKTELWPRVVAAYKGYAGYQQRTSRDIPLVILEPEG